MSYNDDECMYKSLRCVVAKPELNVLFAFEMIYYVCNAINTYMSKIFYIFKLLYTHHHLLLIEFCCDCSIEE